jgi:hypothetical protein
VGVGTGDLIHLLLWAVLGLALPCDRDLLDWNLWASLLTREFKVWQVMTAAGWILEATAAGGDRVGLPGWLWAGDVVPRLLKFDGICGTLAFTRKIIEPLRIVVLPM